VRRAARGPGGDAARARAASGPGRRVGGRPGRLHAHAPAPAPPLRPRAARLPRTNPPGARLRAGGRRCSGSRRRARPARPRRA
jgi:hypothetical protein